MSRRLRILLSLLLLVLSVPFASPAQRTAGGHPSGGKSIHSARHEKHSRIERSAEAKRDFMRQSGYPHGRKGYVVDHIVPLACGGPEFPSNMQWQTKAEAKAKDKWERKGCSRP